MLGKGVLTRVAGRTWENQIANANCDFVFVYFHLFFNESLIMEDGSMQAPKHPPGRYWVC